MKKKLFLLTGMAALVALMAYNVQLFESDHDSDISLAYMENMANAQDEDGCSGTQVTVNCYDAAYWVNSAGNPYYHFYERVCDEVKCGRAWFHEHDGIGSCTYCNE